MKNRKRGQVGEVIEDFPAFIIIGVMLILMIVLTVLFHGNSARNVEDKENDAISRDKIDVLLYSMVQEKRDDGLTFSDLIRNKSAGVKDRLQREVNAICLQKNQECYTELRYDGKCWGSPAYKDNFCFLVPGKDNITINVYYGFYYGDVGMAA